MHCKGTRDYNTSFKDNLRLVESKTSRNTSITKEKLKPGTKYTIYVTAFTEKEEGAASDAVTKSTLAKGNSEHHHCLLNSTMTFCTECKPRLVIIQYCNTSKCQPSPLPQSELPQVRWGGGGGEGGQAYFHDAVIDFFWCLCIWFVMFCES